MRLAGDPPGQTRFVATLRETEVLLGSPTVYSSSTAAAIDPADPALGWVGGVYWIPNQWGGRQPAMWINSVSLLDPATLFADGFETGDAGAWSAAVP